MLVHPASIIVDRLRTEKKRGQKNIKILKRKCWRCGAPATATRHPSAHTRTGTCSNCNTVGHLARVCMKGRKAKGGNRSLSPSLLPDRSHVALAYFLSRFQCICSCLSKCGHNHAWQQANSLRLATYRRREGARLSHGAIDDWRWTLNHQCLAVKHGLKINREGLLLRAANGEMMNVKILPSSITT